MKIERKRKVYQTGFTMIELIAIVVILYVLGATTISRFIDFSSAAQDAEIKNIASALTSVASLNHANNIAYDAGLSKSVPVEVVDCQSAAVLLEADLHKQYLIENGPGVVIDNDGVDREGGSSSCFIAFDANNDGVLNITDEPRESFMVYGVRN